MDVVHWPTLTAETAGLINRFLDEAAPGWRGDASVTIGAGEVCDTLWAFLAQIGRTPDQLIDARLSPGADQVIELIALHGAALPDDLDPGVRAILRGRTITSLAPATLRSAEGLDDPVLIVPRGLDAGHRRRFIILALLHQTSIDLGDVDLAAVSAG